MGNTTGSARRKQRSGKATLISVIVAGVLVVALALGGTVLRMRSREMDFGAAFVSFMSDTFHAGSYAPDANT